MSDIVFLKSKCTKKPEIPSQVLADSPLSLIFIFKNVGSNAWPQGVTLKQIHGDELNISPVLIKDPIPADQDAYINIDFKTPSKPGKYHAFLRLVHSGNIEFGEKIWIDFEVIQKAEVDFSDMMLSKLEDQGLKLSYEIMQTSSPREQEEPQPKIEQVKPIENLFQPSQQVIQPFIQVEAPDQPMGDDKDKSMFQSHVINQPAPQQV